MKEQECYNSAHQDDGQVVFPVGRLTLSWVLSIDYNFLDIPLGSRCLLNQNPFAFYIAIDIELASLSWDCSKVEKIKFS